MEVRHQISEQLVIHMARREHMLDHLRDAVNVVPERGDFGGAQAREVRNVTPSKDDDRMATSDGMSLQVCVAHASGVKGLTGLVPAKPAPRPLFPGVPVLRPCSCHYVFLTRGYPAQCPTEGANFQLTRYPRVWPVDTPWYEWHALLSSGVGWRSAYEVLCVRRIALSAVLLMLGFSGLQAQQAKASFEVASIRPNSSQVLFEGLARMGPRVRPGGVYSGTHATVAALIAFAYDLNDYQISGAPEWTRQDFFHIDARAKQPDASVEEIRLMMRSLLEQRLELVAHKETRDIRHLALVLARRDRRLGPNLIKLDECNPGIRNEQLKKFTPSLQSGMTAGCSTGGKGLAEILPIKLRTPVIDATGLDGTFFFFLRSSSPESRSRAGAISEAEAAALPSAVEEQLGLKLESRKDPMEVLVVDSVQRPTMN